MDLSSIKQAQEAIARMRELEDRFGGINKLLSDRFSPFGSQIAEMQRISSELNKRNQAILDIGGINSPLRDAITKLGEIKNSHITSSLSSALTNVNKIANEHLKVITQTKKLNLSNNFFNHNISSAIFAGSLRLGEIEALRNSALNTLPSEQFRTLLSDFQSSLNKSHLFEQINVIRDSFAGNLALAFRDVIESSENQQEALDKVEAIVEEKFAQSSDSSFTTQNTLALIVSLLSLIVALYFNSHNASISQESTESQQIRFEQLLKVIEKIAENTSRGSENSETYYAVEREFDVRANPTFKSMKFGRLFPNTKVKLITEKHKWVYIEWTDYLEAVPRYGWINKKYLKKLKPVNSIEKKELDNSNEQKENSLLNKVDETRLSDAEVTNLGVEVFGDMEKFKLWLNTPNLSLGNLKPVELLNDTNGKELVISELTRINYGILV